MQAWFEGYAADGFIIQGGTPDTFPRFVDQVVPMFQARGLFRTDYPGTTLRESLGLRRTEKPVHTTIKENPAMQKTSLLLALALASCRWRLGRGCEY